MATINAQTPVVTQSTSVIHNNEDVANSSFTYTETITWKPDTSGNSWGAQLPLVKRQSFAEDSFGGGGGGGSRPASGVVYPRGNG